MKKGIKNTLAAFFVLAGAGLLTGCGFHYTIGFGNGGNYLDRDDAKEFKVEKSAVDPITSINIHTGMAEVELVKSDDFYVEIDYLYWEEEPEYSLDNGKLYFDDSDSFPNSYSINFSLNNTVKIYLPEASALEDLSIENSTGDVTLAGFVADDMDVTVSYGDLTLKDAAAAEADITLSSGRSRISDFQAGELNFRNSYGNADFTNINTGDALLPADVSYDSADITMSSGDVRITGMNIASVEIDNSYGNITCKDIIANDFRMELSSGNLNVDASDLKNVDIRNSYGDVTLNLSAPAEDYSLDLDTSYGDIKVDGKSYDEHLVLENAGAGEITAKLSSGDIKVTFK
jgi:DUF4097 and DUF4098 domain-containing protein YvlB